MNYEDVYDTFINKGCKLITNKEEYFILKQTCKIPKLSYIASCGHNNSVHYNVFKSRNTGIICPKCVVSKNNISSGKVTETGQSLKHYYYSISVNYIINAIKCKYTYKTTHEGSAIDLLIKPLEETSDLWLQVKIKTTNNVYNNAYSFNNTKNTIFKDCIILCHCNHDNKMWLFTYFDVNNKTKISIGNNSKYSDNEINIDNINEKLLLNYNSTNLISSEVEIDSLYKCLKVEYEYAELRKMYIKYDFTNVCKYSHTDFKYLGRNIQEKVGSKYKNKNSVNFKLTKRNGKLVYCKPYDKGDNDLYWLHFPNKKCFYLIPENKLLVNEDTGVLKKNLYINVLANGYPISNHLNYYLFEYENMDYQRFDSLISLC